MLKEKNEIIQWLDENKISNYELLEDEVYGHIVNINGDFNFNFCTKELPFKFGKIFGSFYSTIGNLESLKGCPDYIQNNFSCMMNKIKDLNYFPKFIGKNIDLSNNQIDELKNLPSNINGFLNVTGNNLQNIVDISLNGDNSFMFMNNPIKELKNFHIGDSLFLDIKIIEKLTLESIKNIKDKKNLKIYFYEKNENFPQLSTEKRITINDLDNLIKKIELKEKIQNNIKIKNGDKNKI